MANDEIDDSTTFKKNEVVGSNSDKSSSPVSDDLNNEVTPTDNNELCKNSENKENSEQNDNLNKTNVPANKDEESNVPNSEEKKTEDDHIQNSKKDTFDGLKKTDEDKVEEENINEAKETEKETKDDEKQEEILDEEKQSESESISLKSPPKNIETKDQEETESKKDDEPEVGIVETPTIESEISNDDKKEAEANLPTEVKESVTEQDDSWIDNSDIPSPVDLVINEDEVTDEEKDKENATQNNDEEATKNSENENGSPNKNNQKVVTNIIRKSISLNKMHATENPGTGDSVKPESPVINEVNNELLSKTPSMTITKIPQNQQNGAALPEETASIISKKISVKTKSEPELEKEPTKMPVPIQKSNSKTSSYSQRAPKTEQEQHPKTEGSRKRRIVEGNNNNINNLMMTSGTLVPASNGSSLPKKMCLEQREQFITSIIGSSEKLTAEQLASKAEQLKSEVQDLDELARAKEMEWNEILSMRKLKEEAYLRLERRRQIIGFMENNVQTNDFLPPASLTLNQCFNNLSNLNTLVKVKTSLDEQINSSVFKKEKTSKTQINYHSLSSKHASENGSKQIDHQTLEQKQIGEGRQGPIVDVRSIIADYRLAHPDTIPRRRGRRMRNSVNVGLGAGGAMVENVSAMDSRPSSTDSCKSNSNVPDPSVSFKDVLVQFAKLSQQQDVTLHPVPVTTASQQNSSMPQTSGSLLHGILTKSQSPRPATFSPTLARLLTAPERERSNTSIVPNPHHQNTSSQHLLQTYQSNNPVSISDFLTSTKARTEITITPVVNVPIQGHSNNAMNADDEEDTSIIEERNSVSNRDGRDDRGETPPRCQGCHERAAQFVCAGCGNQWYCSRECQVAAWDDHSEVCSG